MWLISFNTEIAEIERDTHLLLQADNSAMAERGAQLMGKTWWPELQQEKGGHWWRYPNGVVWFNAITLLDDHETAVLQGLKFLDCWQVTVTAGELIINNEFGNHWLDFER